MNLTYGPSPPPRSIIKANHPRLDIHYKPTSNVAVTEAPDAVVDAIHREGATINRVASISQAVTRRNSRCSMDSLVPRIGVLSSIRMAIVAMTAATVNLGRRGRLYCYYGGY